MGLMGAGKLPAPIRPISFTRLTLIANVLIGLGNRFCFLNTALSHPLLLLSYFYRAPKGVKPLTP
ncbi:hypothetical protein GCM10028819_34250 [Spirosoma humi]